MAFFDHYLDQTTRSKLPGANYWEQTIITRNAMSSKSATLKPMQCPTSLQPKDSSISQMIKDAGFEDMTHVMNSYGLKRHDEADFQKAQAILEAFRDVDQKD